MTEPTSPPPVDRELLSRDLTRLGRALASRTAALLPPPLLWALRRSGVDLSRPSGPISSAPQALLALDDATIACLLDALATEIGAVRGVRAPVEPTPELEAALERLARAVGG